MPSLDFLPFTWTQFGAATGRKLTDRSLARLSSVLAEQTEQTWANARGIIVAPQLSAIGMTLWQCAEVCSEDQITGADVPSRDAIVAALCFAGGFPIPAAKR